MERAVEIFAAVCFLIIGLSHLLQPLAWVDFFQMLRAKGRAGVFIDGFLCMNFGALIIAFHRVWHWPGIVLTLIGCGQILKGALRFIAPALILSIYERITPERAWMFRAAGGLALAFSLFLFWGLFR